MKLTGKEILFVKTFKDLNPIVVGTTIETFSLSNDRKCISLEVRFDDERETLFFFSKEREDEYHKSSIATIDGVRVTYDSLSYYIKAEAEKLYALNKIAYIVEITSTGTYYVSKTKNSSIPIEHIAGADDIAFDSKKDALQFIDKHKNIGKVKIIETTKEALDEYFKARDKYNDSCKILFNTPDIRQEFEDMA